LFSIISKTVENPIIIRQIIATKKYASKGITQLGATYTVEDMCKSSWEFARKSAEVTEQ